MLLIQKRATPRSLSEQVIGIEKSEEWQKLSDEDSGSVRSYFDSLDKYTIRKNLFAEQHGLCAYCMSRIREDGSMVIEHFKPIKNKQYALDYQNMIGCCDGGRSCDKSDKKVLCCDASKGNKNLTIDPRDKTFIDSIKYNRDGFIQSSNPEADRQINDILNLNGIRDEKGNLKFDTATRLVAGRKNVYKCFSKKMETLNGRVKSKERMHTEIRKMIEKIENSDEYPEYAGVMLYFLKRRLRNIS